MKKSLSRRITVYFLIILILTVVVSAAWNYYSTRQFILDMERTQAEDCAMIISGLLENYRAGNETQNSDMKDDQSIRSAVRDHLIDYGMNAMYIYTRDKQDQQRRMLLAVAEDD